MGAVDTMVETSMETVPGTAGEDCPETADSWSGAELMEAVQPLGAAAQARLALAAEVDDPEELQLALQALEQERQELGCNGESAAANSLLEELRVRVGAMREE